jgi:hypothetical protein
VLIRIAARWRFWNLRSGAYGARELKPFAGPAESAAKRLEEFEAGPWGKKYPMIAQSWRRNWEQIVPFYSFAPEVRKIIYTTNAIESLHIQLRKVLKNRGHFPSDEEATKLIYLALRNITKQWKNPPVTWRVAADQFAIQFGERLTNEAIAFAMGAMRPQTPRLEGELLGATAPWQNRSRTKKNKPTLNTKLRILPSKGRFLVHFGGVWFVGLRNRRSPYGGRAYLCHCGLTKRIVEVSLFRFRTQNAGKNLKNFGARYLAFLG